MYEDVTRKLRWIPKMMLWKSWLLLNMSFFRYISMLNFSGVNIWDLKWARPGVLLGIQMQRLNIDDTRALSLIPCNVKDAQCLYQTLTLLISSAFFLKSLQPSTFDKRHFSFPGRLDVLDLKCCELVIFAKPPVRGNSLNDRPTVTPVRWRSKKEWTKDSSVVTPCPVSGNMPPIWPCREGRNPISSHLATRNRGPKPIFWVWFDWEGSVFLAAMLRKVPACNNLRIFRKEIQENRFSNFGCVFIQAFRHCFFLPAKCLPLLRSSAVYGPVSGRCFVGAVDPLKALLKKTTHGFWMASFSAAFKGWLKTAADLRTKVMEITRGFQWQEAEMTLWDVEGFFPTLTRLQGM